MADRRVASVLALVAAARSRLSGPVAASRFWPLCPLVCFPDLRLEVEVGGPFGAVLVLVLSLARSLEAARGPRERCEYNYRAAGLIVLQDAPPRRVRSPTLTSHSLIHSFIDRFDKSMLFASLLLAGLPMAQAQLGPQPNGTGCTVWGMATQYYWQNGIYITVSPRAGDLTVGTAVVRDPQLLPRRRQQQSRLVRAPPNRELTG